MLTKSNSEGIPVVVYVQPARAASGWVEYPTDLALLRLTALSPAQARSSYQCSDPALKVSDKNWQVNKSRNIISVIINCGPPAAAKISHNHVGRLLS